MRLFGARRLCTDAPGAERSGLRTPSPLVAHCGTLNLPLPFGSAAATAMTYGSVAGALRRFSERPSLPAAATTTMPARQARSTAKARGSMVYGRFAPLLYDRLITRMFNSFA